MTRLLLLFALCPLIVVAQPDTLRPIENDLLPANYWNGYGWQSGVKTQYIYNGLDIRAKDLGQYIIASGDADATRQYNAYLNSRQAGGWLIAGGLLTAVIGAPIMLSNGPGSDGKFTTQQPYICPTGYACGGTATNGKLVYGGQVVFYQDVTDTQRKNAFNTGSALLLGGAILAGIGWGLKIPGRHVRRSVQYYNRALKERGISWRLTPYSSGNASGVGLVGRL